MRTAGRSTVFVFRVLVCVGLFVMFTGPLWSWSRRDASYSGLWQDTGTGWWYRYNRTTDTEEWNYSGKMRFAYQWNVGQWWTYGGDAWSRLGLGNVSSSYIMDGNYHDLRNGWWYRYTLSDDTSIWNFSGKLRFAFQYTVRQWWDHGNIWSRIGIANGYSAFVGDGAYHDMRNGWWYSYSTSTDTAMWNYSGKTRFAFQYTVGQWWNHGDVGDWFKLGASGVSNSFIGDGSWHNLDSIWSYRLLASSDMGYLQGSVYTPYRGTWNYESSKQYTCNYKTQVFGLQDTSSISSVFLYDYASGSGYSSKWYTWNYNLSDRKQNSQAIVHYSGSTTRDVSSWLNWLPVLPKSGYIIRTETWDYRNDDWSNRYNHEVRAFGNNMWLVQREQGDHGNCGIIASIDSISAKSGKYLGYTKYWHDTAYSKGWASQDGGTTIEGQAHLMLYMSNQIGSPVNIYYGAPTARSLDNLVDLVKNGSKVILGVQLSYLPSFQSSGGHAICLVGDTYINGVRYAQITNGWNIQSNTTQISGTDPTRAYPITNILYSDLVYAYNNSGYGYSRTE